MSKPFDQRLEEGWENTVDMLTDDRNRAVMGSIAASGLSLFTEVVSAHEYVFGNEQLGVAGMLGGFALAVVANKLSQ